jgi:glucan 1,3-beta-glucosidase
MISEAGTSLAMYSDNVNVYTDNIALFQLAAGSGGGGSPTTTSSSVPTTLTTSIKSTSSPTGTTGWTLLGCYTDNVGGRTLVNGEPVPGGASSMTVEACQSVCLGLGYVLAGVEYADECCKYPITIF